MTISLLPRAGDLLLSPLTAGLDGRPSWGRAGRWRPAGPPAPEVYRDRDFPAIRTMGQTCEPAQRASWKAQLSRRVDGGLWLSLGSCPTSQGWKSLLTTSHLTAFLKSFCYVAIRFQMGCLITPVLWSTKKKIQQDLGNKRC